MNGPEPITEPCPACARVAVLALDDDSQFVLVERDEDGSLAGEQDGNRFVWVRPVTPGELLAVGEELYRLHEPLCPAPIAPVRNIGTARSLRRRAARTETSRRTASAR
jgi:hypothetical protein